MKKPTIIDLFMGSSMRETQKILSKLEAKKKRTSESSDMYIEEDGALVGPGGVINGASNPKDVKKMRKQLNKENTMIRLKDLLPENKENQISLMKITILMEKTLPELTSAESKKLMELCAEVHKMAEELNKTPYTIYNAESWQVLEAQFVEKLMAVKEEAEKHADKAYVKPLLSALTEVIAD